MIRFIFLFFSGFLFNACFPLFLEAQEMPVKVIPQVVVESHRKFFSDDQTRQSVDPETLNQSQHRDIGFVLDKLSPALIRSYGAGALTSISLHGTGSSHTQVSWNGIPLNSPTTGQADLSLIPAGFMQSIELIHGASGALFGSGTFGGSVNLGNEPDWNNKLTVDYSLNVGSYESIGNLLSFNTGNARIQYRFTAQVSKASNDFFYRDHYRHLTPEIKNKHNEYKTVGFIHDLHLNFDRGNRVDGGFWYQQKVLEIPTLMGSFKSGNAVQKDSLMRSFISYRKNTSKFALVLRSAWFTDNLHYTDKENYGDTLNTLDSRIATERLMHEADYRYYLSSMIIIGGGMTYSTIKGHSNNYGGTFSENEFALYGNLKLIYKDLIFNAALRKEFYEGLNPLPQYSFGIRYKPFDRLILRTGFSSKFRKPTLNEKYWKPGGNPMLNPEKGQGGEVTVEWKTLGKEGAAFWIETRLTGYYQVIENWIQWTIQDSLTPREYKEVHASGLAAWLDYGLLFGNVNFVGRANYNFNRSVIVNTYDNDLLFEGNQLMYIPLHTFKLFSEIRYKRFILGFSTTYTGVRETVETADASLRLPAFTLVDLHAAYRRSFGPAEMAVSFYIENVFDTRYEVIRAYPLPGRTYHFSLSIGFSKANSEN